MLDGGWKCFGQFSRVPLRCALQRLDGVGFVEMDHGVELIGETSEEIVAEALGFRSGK